MPFDVDDDAPVGHAARRWRLTVSATQQGADAGHQLVGAERLRHVVVGADVKADDPFRFLGASRQYDDRDARRLLLASYRATDIEAADIRQHEVEHEQIRRAVGNGRQRVFPGRQDPRRIAGLLECPADEVGDVSVVFDNEDMHQRRIGVVVGTDDHVRYCKGPARHPVWTEYLLTGHLDRASSCGISASGLARPSLHGLP